MGGCSSRIRVREETCVVVDLPEEIVVEIVSRLSVKSVLRLRCVSKGWRSMIDSDWFVTRHLRLSATRRGFERAIVLGEGVAECSLQKLLTKKRVVQRRLWHGRENDFKVVGCCNGVVCILVSPDHAGGGGGEKGGYWLWNPTKRRLRKLPPRDDDDDDNYSSSRYAADIDLPVAGFGWDESSGEYKVCAFAVENVRSGQRLICKVYSTKSNAWKVVEMEMEMEMRFRSSGGVSVSREGVFVSGKIHWARMVEEGEGDIVWFDLKSEEFGVVKLMEQPRWDIIDAGFWSVGVVDQDCLCVVYVQSLALNLDVEVWVMKEEYGWLKLFSTTPFDLRPTQRNIYLTHGSGFMLYNPQLSEISFYQNVFLCLETLV